MAGLDAFWCGALLTIILTGIYSVFGGLRAVLYTDACQAIILLLGSIFILYFGLSMLGGDNGGVMEGWGKLRDFTATNASKYALWHPLSDKDFPWLAICIASPIIGIWYWCTDQYIVQRTLAAKNLTIARRGTIWGAALKVMPVMIFLIPEGHRHRRRQSVPDPRDPAASSRPPRSRYRRPARSPHELSLLPLQLLRGPLHG